MFDEKEKAVIAELVSKTQVSPLQKNGAEILAILQSILVKVTPEVPTEPVKE
jgi:hypothetical protein